MNLIFLKYLFGEKWLIGNISCRVKWRKFSQLTKIFTIPLKVFPYFISPLPKLFPIKVSNYLSLINACEIKLWKFFLDISKGRFVVKNCQISRADLDLKRAIRWEFICPFKSILVITFTPSQWYSGMSCTSRSAFECIIGRLSKSLLTPYDAGTSNQELKL